MDRTCPACSARLDQHATSCPNRGADLAAGGTDQSTEAGAAGEAVRNTAVAAHLSTFAGLTVPFGSVIGPLAVWLTRRHRDPFIDQAGRAALNFGISIAIYGSVLLVAALMLVGIPLLVVGVVAWVVLASLAAVKASQGQPYRYPLTLRLVRWSDQAQHARPSGAAGLLGLPTFRSNPLLGTSHNPLDVVGGAAVGLAIAAALDLLLDVARDRAGRRSEASTS